MIIFGFMIEENFFHDNVENCLRHSPHHNIESRVDSKLFFGLLNEEELSVEVLDSPQLRRS